MTDMYRYRPADAPPQTGLLGHFFTVLSLIATKGTRIFVDWSSPGVANYLSRERGNNPWEYWFEQPCPAAAACPPEDCLDHIITPRFLYSHLPWKSMNLPGWLEDTARETIAKHVRFKSVLSCLVEDFCQREFAGHRVMGAHIRGTDQWQWHGREHPAGIPLDRYFAAIDARIDKFDRVFVMSDSQGIMDEFTARYGEKIIAFGAIRSPNEQALHRGGYDGYRIGTDVLAEALILSRCEFALLCSSNVSFFARCSGRFAYTYVDYDFGYVN
jgi:hypothetical protein